MKHIPKIRNSVIAAQGKIYTTVNCLPGIGEQIYIACGENDRTEYGKGLLKYLSEKLTTEFETGLLSVICK